MYWFSFRNEKRKSNRRDPIAAPTLAAAQRSKDNVVIQALTDWMVANGSVKDSK